MSTNNNEEDDWEKAAENLSNIKLEQLPPPKSITIMARPPMIINPPSSGNPPIQSPDSNGTNTINNSTNDNETIDSAILNAMNNPRERMTLFQIENFILKFVESNESFMEVPPGMNSFRRLLVYRVAERFQLDRAPSDTSNEAGEKGIILRRTALTCVPPTLLIDMKLDANDSISSGNSEKVVESTKVVSPSSATADPPVKKLLLKRRNDKDNSAQSSASGKFSNKQQVSAEEREKQYLEARARIFGEEGASSGDVNESSPQSAEKKVTKSNSTNDLSVSETNNTTDATTATTSSTQQKRENRSLPQSTSSPQLNFEENIVASSSKSRGKAMPDLNSWSSKKGQLRDVNAEKSDPDFIRRTVTPNYNNNNHNNAANYAMQYNNNYAMNNNYMNYPANYSADYNNSFLYNPVNTSDPQAFPSLPGNTAGNYYYAYSTNTQPIHPPAIMSNTSQSVNNSAYNIPLAPTLSASINNNNNFHELQQFSELPQCGLNPRASSWNGSHIINNNNNNNTSNSSHSYRGNYQSNGSSKSSRYNNTTK